MPQKGYRHICPNPTSVLSGHLSKHDICPNITSVRRSNLTGARGPWRSSFTGARGSCDWYLYRKRHHDSPAEQPNDWGDEKFSRRIRFSDCGTSARRTTPSLTTITKLCTLRKIRSGSFGGPSGWAQSIKMLFKNIECMPGIYRTHGAWGHMVLEDNGA